MEKPKSQQSSDSFEKTEDLLTPDERPTPRNEADTDQADKHEIEAQMVREMIQNDKFTTFQSPETDASDKPKREPQAEDFKTESLKNYIDQFGNLEPTESQKRVEISEKYDVGLKQQPQVTNSRYQNYDSNIPEGQDNEKGRATDLNEITRFGNKSLFGNPRFTESTNMRIDDYKRTTNYQQLIEEELLKEKMSVPELPESVINPKSPEKQHESGSRDDRSEEESGREESGQEEEQEEGGNDGRGEEGDGGSETGEMPETEETPEDRKEGIGKLEPGENAQKRHLTVIQRGRDTDFNMDNDSFLVKLTNDLDAEEGKKPSEPENSMAGADIFENELVSERFENKKSFEEIEDIKEEEPEKEASREHNEVSNLVKEDQDLEKQNWFKKERRSSEEEGDDEEKEQRAETGSETREPAQEASEKSRHKQAFPSRCI